MILKKAIFPDDGIAKPESFIISPTFLFEVEP